MDPIQIVFWQTSQNLSSDFQKSLEVFYSRIDSVCSAGNGLVIDTDIDRLLKRCLDLPGIRYAAVMAVGTLFPNQTKISELFLTAIKSQKKNFLVMGHLINKPGRYCGLHEQTLIVDLKTYKDLGMPPFGAAESGPKTLCGFTAGPSIHDNYTPRFVTPHREPVSVSSVNTGWNFVHSSLQNGFPVYNLPDDLRNEKIYCYPDDSIEILNRNLELFYQMKDLDNPSQRRVLGFLFNKRFGFDPAHYGSRVCLSDRVSSVFLLNSEYLVPDQDWVKTNRQPLDHYLGPCSGFLECASLYAHGFTPQTKITYFDVNPQSFHYKQKMLETFDGRFKNLEKIFSRFQKESPWQPFVIGDIATKISRILEVFGSEENFISTWHKVKQLPKEYLHLNLISNHQSLLKQVQPENRSLIAISDIFTGQNELTYGWTNLNLHYDEFLQSCKVFPNLIISGNDCLNRSFVAKVSDLK